MDTSYQKTVASDEWYTPKWILDALGPFDLDPCAPMKPLWRTAARMVDKEEDGLKIAWEGGRVWCNPPYSKPLLMRFCEKMVENGNGILLMFSRTGNNCFQEILMPNADAVLFMRRRIQFYLPDGSLCGNPGSDSCLIAFGKNNVKALKESGIEGLIMERGGEWMRQSAPNLLTQNVEASE